MQRFFLTVFGGLLLIVIGLAISYGGAWGWRIISPYASSVSGSILKQADGTSISGFHRTIRYSADEEEDLINTAAEALSKATNGPITAGAYIVKNLVLDEAVMEHNPDQLLPIASLVKIVTAVVARRLIAGEKHITISREIMAAYGNTANFVPGETFKANNLLYPLLLVSSNDAAEALAESHGRKKFIQAMNDFVQSIGAYRTYLADPSGLSSRNVSTASDLAIILDWIVKNDKEIIDITRLKGKTIRSHTWINPTHFLNWSNYLGGKNGYTPEADRTGAALFALGPNKDTYAVIVLGSKFRDADVIKLLGKIK